MPYAHAGKASCFAFKNLFFIHLIYKIHSIYRRRL